MRARAFGNWRQNKKQKCLYNKHMYLVKYYVKYKHLKQKLTIIHIIIIVVTQTIIIFENNTINFISTH